MMRTCVILSHSQVLIPFVDLDVTTEQVVHLDYI